MLQAEIIKSDLKRQSDTMDSIKESLNIPELTALKDRLKARQEEPDFFSDMEEVKKISKQLKTVENKLDLFESLVKRIEDLADLTELAESENDSSLEEEILSELKQLKKDIEEFNLTTLLRGDYDACDAVLTLHAGAGGTEAQDWTQMLYRMYSRYCERNGLKYRVLDELAGDEAGLKSITFEVEGDNAYGYLKAEKGVHRLVRISPFDSNARRHTSFAALEVAPILEQAEAVEIRPEDLKIDTYRSGGAGGQHVNKTESAIRITHIPSGIIVACQNERSQIQNRETAMRMLAGKLAELREREQMEKAQSIKGELKKIEWGNQIRSYVFHPYSMVKDHRTSFETSDVFSVMDGDIKGFIDDYLRKS